MICACARAVSTHVNSLGANHRLRQTSPEVQKTITCYEMPIRTAMVAPTIPVWVLFCDHCKPLHAPMSITCFSEQYILQKVLHTSVSIAYFKEMEQFSVRKMISFRITSFKKWSQNAKPIPKCIEGKYESKPQLS